jgi:hypothetical protein
MGYFTHHSNEFKGFDPILFPTCFRPLVFRSIEGPSLVLLVGFNNFVCILSSARDGRKVLLTLDKRLVFFLKAKNFIVP